MLTVTIPGSELWDEKNQRFITTKPCKLVLEHSLVSISKWEAKWKKPFLDTMQKNVDETLDYIKCMTITQNVPDDVYLGITKEVMEEINAYINDPMTATTFQYIGDNKSGGSSRNKKITSELIYYWMIALEIPMECQRWHINRLLTLIKVCNHENNPGKKMSKRDILSNNAKLNAARRKRYNSKG